MKGMIDGRRLKQGWDENRLGPLLLGEGPFAYEEEADEVARFTRLRQVTDFLRCRSESERARVLPSLLAALEGSDEGWARAAAQFVRHSFGHPATREGAGKGGTHAAGL